MPSPFLKKNLRNFAAYKPGKQPQLKKGEAFETIKLNTNENPFPPLEIIEKTVRKLLENKAKSLRLYPDPTQTELRNSAVSWFNRSIPKSKKFEIENFFFGNGSDEFISCLFRTFLESGEKVAIPSPAYGAYAVYAASYGFSTLKLPAEKDFSFRLQRDDFQEIMEMAKIVFFTNPAAPSGWFTPTSEITECVKRYKKTLFVIDEAYIDFSKTKTTVADVNLENLIVLRTFSKSPSLAAIRLGYAIAHTDLISAMKKTLDPYNLNMVAQKIGASVFNDYNQVLENAQKVVKLRTLLEKSLKKRGFFVVPSQANFLLVRPFKKNAKSLYEFLTKENIHVRFFANELPTYLRISIGTADENNRLLKAIDSF